MTTQIIVYNFHDPSKQDTLNKCRVPGKAIEVTVYPEGVTKIVNKLSDIAQQWSLQIQSSIDPSMFHINIKTILSTLDL